MRKFVFIFFIFCWNLGFTQNQSAIFVSKSDAKNFKFKLPAKIEIAMKRKFQIVDGIKVFEKSIVMLTKVINDSLFIESIDHKLSRKIIWDSVEEIKFSSANEKVKNSGPLIIASSVLVCISAGLIILSKNDALGFGFSTLIVSAIPLVFIDWGITKKQFNPHDYFIVN